MLKVIRKEGTIKKIMWVLAVIIILSFGVFGTASYYDFNQKSGYAGKIFGKKISVRDFEKNYLNSRDRQILLYGDNFKKVSQFINIESETWDHMILLHEAKRKKLSATDQEVIDFIQQLSFFKRDGNFDKILYNDILRYVFKRSPRDFEEGVRNSLIVKKLFDQEIASLNIDEEEIRRKYNEQNEKIQASFIFISPEKYKNEVSVTEDELKTYFESSTVEFTLPPSINLDYISLFVPQNATDEQKNTIAEQANAIYNEITTSSDFNEIAQKNNLTAQESGFFSMDQPFLSLGLSYLDLQNIFSQDTGSVNGPLETPKGYHILRVKEKRDAYTPEFKEAKDKIRARITDIKASKVAEEKAKAFALTIKESYSSQPDFKTIVEKLGFEVEQTPLFNRGQYLPVIGLSNEFQEEAFRLNADRKISDVVQTAKGFCILHFDQKEPVNEEQFEKDKTTFASTLMNEKMNSILTDFISQLRNKANLESYLTKG